LVTAKLLLTDKKGLKPEGPGEPQPTPLKGVEKEFAEPF